MQLKKISAKTASEVCADITLDEEALALLSDTAAPSEFLGQLIEAKHYQDAIRFLARALPGREAAWWACLSARNGVGDQTPATEITLLELAEQWVFKPIDENRHTVHDATDTVESGTPVYWAGMAVFWSGGSMVNPDLPVVLVQPNMCSMAVSGGVILAGLRDDIDDSDQLYQLFLKQGVAIANGDNAKDVV